MRKTCAAALAVVLLVFCSCGSDGEQARSEPEQYIYLSFPKEPDSITVTFGTDPFIMNGASEAVTGRIISELNTLRLKRSEEKPDIMSALKINFLKDGESVTVTIDKNGVIMTGKSLTAYTAITGSFDYEWLLGEYNTRKAAIKD